jgi:hypothetical protein
MDAVDVAIRMEALIADVTEIFEVGGGVEDAEAQEVMWRRTMMTKISLMVPRIFVC